MNHLMTLLLTLKSLIQVNLNALKVRYAARMKYERTSQVIGLNFVYLLMLNSHCIQNMCVREREGESQREKGRERF